jgi:hypothetical protein
MRTEPEQICEIISLFYFRLCAPLLKAEFSKMFRSQYIEEGAKFVEAHLRFEEGISLFLLNYSYFNSSWPRRMAYSEMLPCLTLVRTDVSEELSASFIRVTRIVELGTTLAVTMK